MPVDEPTVFIVDDDEAMRDSLCMLVGARTGLRVESYDSAEGFLEVHDPARPGCLVLDVRMPGMGGLALQERLLADGVEIPIVFLSGHGDIRMAVGAVQRGAVDFIEKPFTDRVLIDRIKRAIALDARRRRVRAASERVSERLARLKDRERQIMRLLINGRTSKQIAAELRISLPAVSMYRSRILEKLQADNVVDLTRMLVSPRTSRGS
jgi:FixJ family two-component response regulator